MHLHFAFGSSGQEARRGGVALASVLLAVPLFFVTHPDIGVLLGAASFVGAVAFLEARARGAARPREVTPQAPAPLRLSPRSAQCRAHWEMVDRDGHRSLLMRWR